MNIEAFDFERSMCDEALIRTVLVTTKIIQNRKHKKKRINKKWAKKYGYTIIEVQEKPILFNGIIYCRQRDFDLIKNYEKR